MLALFAAGVATSRRHPSKSDLADRVEMTLDRLDALLEMERPSADKQLPASCSVAALPGPAWPCKEFENAAGLQAACLCKDVGNGGR